MFRPRFVVSAWLTICALSCAAGCVYPRRATPLTTVMHSPVDRSTQPENLWQLQIVEAEIPRQTRTGQYWDDDDGPPDVYFVLAIKGSERWRTEAILDSFTPKFSNPSPNLSFDRNARVRLELWDKDGMSADPIGIYEGKALSDVFLDADTTISLNGGATITLRLRKPEPRAGTGIAEYELRPSGAVVRLLVPNSPASRAGLRDGDRIVAIDGKPLANLSAEAADSALALAAQKKSELAIQRGETKHKVKLDGGYVWPAQ
jgi:PDZ domain